MTNQPSTQDIARYRVRVAKAWMDAKTKDHFDYYVPLKEAAQGLVMVGNEGADWDLMSSIGVAIARAVDAGTDTIRVMKMQWEPMRDACYNAAQSYCLVVGYNAHGETAATT